jgi:hypothetical protein
MSVYRSQWKWGFFLLLLLLTGCGSGITNTSVPVLPACTSIAEDANLYRNVTPDTANTISQFVHGSDLIPVTGDIALIAQREALHLLIEQVREWSAFVDVPVNADYFMRITITMISPQLVEDLVTSQILFTGISNPDFSQEVLKMEEKIAEREEFIFLITLTASEYADKLLPGDAVMVHLPVEKMTLSISSGEKIAPGHWDHYLEEAMNLRVESKHGYLAYPFAVLKDGVCQTVVDKVYSTSLSIHSRDLTINDVSYGEQTWSIDYQPLLKVGNSNNAPSFSQPLDPDINKYNPITEPPKPENGRLKSDTAYWDGYWDQMTRFIWYHLTDSIHP